MKNALRSDRIETVMNRYARRNPRLYLAWKSAFIRALEVEMRDVADDLRTFDGFEVFTAEAA